MLLKVMQGMNPSEFVNSCHERLRTSQEGFDYLKGRNLSVDIIKEEKLGFCDYAIAKKFCDDANGRWKAGPSFFANRIVVPIRDDCGTVVAWASRSVDPNEKGWWNTPFGKEFVLYGLDAARNASFATNKIYIVEGYMDVLALRVAGLRNIAAVMGSNLTLGHVGIILRYCNEIVFAFDGDAPREINGIIEDGPGMKSLKRVVANYGKTSHFKNMAAILLPVPYDPAEYMLENGLDAFLGLEQNIIRD